MASYSCDIYRGAHGSDCTNNGVSVRFKRAIVYDSYNDLPDDLRTLAPDVAHLVVVTRWAGRPNEYKHLEPVVGTKTANTMFGGNFAWTSDSRFRAKHTYPLPIHDREE